MAGKFTEYTIDDLFESYNAVDKINDPHRALELHNEIERRKADGEILRFEKDSPALSPEVRAEKRSLMLMFWMVSVLIFPVFLRMFWVLFAYVYGGIIVLILGKKIESIVAILAVLSSLGFSIGAFVWLYRQYKKHLVDSYRKNGLT